MEFYQPVRTNSRSYFKCCSAFTIFIRLVIAVAITIFLKQSTSPYSQTLIGLHILNVLLYYGLTAEQFTMTVNGRKLTKKERKHCCARFYIYIILILSNILWISCLIRAKEEINPQPEVCFGIFLLLCLSVDICFIKCKNLKYACISY